MTPDIASLVRNPAIGLHEIAEQTGLPLAYVIGYHAGYFSNRDADDLLREQMTRQEERDYEQGHGKGGSDYYADNDTRQPTEAA